MTIDQKIIAAVRELMDVRSVNVITRKELIRFIHENYGITEGSIIPSDYCYNRINDGITLSKPTLFEYLGGGKYRCLGENYPYNGDIYHKDFVVGKCENGVRKIYGMEAVPSLPKIPKITEQKGRTPSKRLRFQVLVRDKSTCRLCGASPTKDPSVTLHIDHIVPWSKGGKTTIDNLQTLCADCNLGKSNVVIE